MDGAKQAPLCGFEIAIPARALDGLHTFFDGRHRPVRPLEKSRQRNPGLTHDPVTPAFRIVEDSPGRAVVPVQHRKRSLDGRRIYVSHQLANQLFLPAKRTVTLHSLRSKHGIFQPLVEVDAVELLAGQSDEPFTERLQSQVLTLSCGLAGL